MLAPMLGLIGCGFYEYSLVADHWRYQAMIGMVAPVVVAGAELSRRAGTRGRVLGAVVVGALGMGTWTRAGVYATSESLRLDTAANNPGAWMTQFNLGLALGREGKIEQAIAHFQETVRFKPRFVEAHSYLGSAFLQAGKTQEAIEAYREALRIRPDYVEAQVNLDRALAAGVSVAR
ncbi:MAG TPA: tetratricopeptide repeat protein [Verrucomicrobiae bacterium]|nr:tetratricopeptide repeat protein [Verrucomicrobiae bacterium]